MPGANSRSTGSAIRWNSFQPFFMRHGNDHPLSVATGMYGRPLDGARGGCIEAVAIVGASGSDAAPALLTSAAPSKAAPEPLIKCRRDIMLLTFGFSGRRRLRRGGEWRRVSGNRQTAAECLLQIGLREPVVLQRVDSAIHRADLVT